MPETVAILICAGLLVVEFLFFCWIIATDKNSPLRVVVAGSVAVFAAVGMLGSAVVYLAMDDFGKYGPAGQAIGWSHYTEPVTSFGGSTVLMVTTTNHTVEVSPNTVFHQGDSLTFSCPPATDESWSHPTAPACKQDTILVRCAKGCVSFTKFMWWWIPMIMANFAMAFWAAFTSWRRTQTAKVA